MKKNAFPIPQLWTEEIALLKKTVSQLPYGANIVEIGTAQGGGFHLIASSRKSSEAASLHSYDPFPGSDLPNLIKRHRNTFFYPLTSTDGAKNWEFHKAGNVDLLIVDGSHTLEAAYHDYTAWKTHLSHPCQILFHDYDPIPRDGASHPGVKVFCDALLSCKKESARILAREGRYLLVGLNSPPAITLPDLKRAFSKWISRSVEIALSFRRNVQTKEDALREQFAYHSRLGDENMRYNKESIMHSDLAFVMQSTSMISSIREALLKESKNRALALKWIEYLEMFLHARSWPDAAFISKASNPLHNACRKCYKIRSLSELCADTSILICIIEKIAQNYRK